MDEAAGNEYMNKTLEGVKFTVYATQDTVESDSSTIPMMPTPSIRRCPM